MQIQKIRELVELGEITTPAAMSRRLRVSEAACKAVLMGWWMVNIEKHGIYCKDAHYCDVLRGMVELGLLTNATKHTYDTGKNRKAVKAELEANWDSLQIGKRMFYVKREGE